MEFKKKCNPLVLIKSAIIFLSLLYGNVALSGATIQKCVDAKGAVTFTDRCPSNQEATDTGMVIDSRSEQQKTDDDAKIQKHLEDLDKLSKITPTPTVKPPQTNPSVTESTPTELSDDDDNNESYDCLSTWRNCQGFNRSNLTPAQKVEILKRKQAQQLPAKIKRR